MQIHIVLYKQHGLTEPAASSQTVVSVTILIWSEQRGATS